VVETSLTVFLPKCLSVTAGYGRDVALYVKENLSGTHQILGTSPNFSHFSLIFLSDHRQKLPSPAARPQDRQFSVNFFATSPVAQQWGSPTQGSIIDVQRKIPYFSSPSLFAGEMVIKMTFWAQSELPSFTGLLWCVLKILQEKHQAHLQKNQHHTY